MTEEAGEVCGPYDSPGGLAGSRVPTGSSTALRPPVPPMCRGGRSAKKDMPVKEQEGREAPMIRRAQNVAGTASRSPAASTHGSAWGPAVA